MCNDYDGKREGDFKKGEYFAHDGTLRSSGGQEITSNYGQKYYNEGGAAKREAWSGDDSKR